MHKLLAITVLKRQFSLDARLHVWLPIVLNHAPGDLCHLVACRLPGVVHK